MNDQFSRPVTEEIVLADLAKPDDIRSAIGALLAKGYGNEQIRVSADDDCGERVIKVFGKRAPTESEITERKRAWVEWLQKQIDRQSRELAELQGDLEAESEA